ncbi:hypothetical protein [Paenibacillus sp. 1001270B_150601_E10]|uniref:hypothetical protein n=1 Tax=Paenibacillus sp. 1001270B_150601_E10 TaxID=2787079 RepID=UPI00189DC8D3|nr:hypothetical protein [Paenibacillus sp. 1001270B_150601_E10]
MSLQPSRRLALMSLAAIFLFTIILGITPRSASAQGMVFPPVTYSAEKQVELNNGAAVFPIVEPTVTAVTYQVETSDPSIANVNVDLHNRTYVIEPLQVGSATVQVTWHDALGNTAAEKFAVMVHAGDPTIVPSVNVEALRDEYLLENNNFISVEVAKVFRNVNQTDLEDRRKYTITDTAGAFTPSFGSQGNIALSQNIHMFKDSKITIKFTKNGISSSIFITASQNEYPEFTAPLEPLQLLNGKEALLDLNAYFSDANGDKLKYDMIQVDSILKVTPTISGSTLIIPAGVDQDFKIQIRADDLRLGTVEGDFNFQVNAVSLKEYAGSYEDTDNDIAVPITEEGQYWLAPFQEWLSQVPGTELRTVDVPAGAAEVTFSLDQSGSQSELPAGIYGIYKNDASGVKLISVIELQGKQVLQQELLSIAQANGRAKIELPDVRQWILKPENQSYKRIRMAMSFL